MSPEQHSSGRHINDLPSVCLQEILSRVGNAPLPLPPNPPTQIVHPIQCAVICKQWRSNADLTVVVRSLAFNFMKVTEEKIRELRRFSSLTHLAFNGIYGIEPEGFEAAAALLAESTQGLQCLELDPHFLNRSGPKPRWDAFESSTKDRKYTWTTALAKALPSWKHLRKLDLGSLHLDNDKEGFRLLFANLGTLPALESLTFTVSPMLIRPLDLYSSPILQQLQLLVRLKELNVSCHVVPTSSMLPTSALKTLHLLPRYQLEYPGHLPHRRFRGEIENFESLGDLSELRHLHLNLEGCDSLTSLAPSLDKLSQLRHLSLQDSSSLTSLAPSLTTLVKLVSLKIDYCLSLSTLSEGPCSLLALMQVDIRNCPSLTALPAVFAQLRSLVSLQLVRCGRLNTLVPLGGLRALKLLRISRCPLKKLPAGIGQLAELERLDISFCPWEKLPQDIGSATSLLELDISGCESLVRLPNQVANLSRLQILRINDCKALNELPGDLGNLQSLQELNLSGCRSLQAIPVGLNQITGLQGLFLAGIMPEVALQLDVGAFLGLKKLSLEASNPPQSWLPSSLSNLCELEWLHIGGKFLQEQTGLVATLETVFFNFASSLDTLPYMPKLEMLQLQNSTTKRTLGRSMKYTSQKI